ncbi:hypothetical protein C2E23DRAFT_798609 [Lenzites betulinus]|nr:hypothetical protein C2E23DRAFT_814221 [Lenzites betulinus]KAH9858438.1 hypothetical protein C2E23DRAFT_798609 [Lenzites betulinus]
MRPAPGSRPSVPPEPDSIMIESHPRSGLPPKIFPFEDFNHSHVAEMDPPPPQSPWHPFLTRADFEFAEFTLDASLSRRQCDTLISLVHRLIKGEDTFTFECVADLQKGWARAAQSRVAPVHT